MPENKYSCPNCSTTLRPKNPLNPGQKVKCPKCQNIFVPVPAAADNEEAETYGVRMESEEEKKKEVEVTRKSMGPVLDRRPRSARGPAVAACTGPGNRLIATASLTCVSCLFTIIVLLWPMFFSKAKVENVGERWLWISFAALAFAYDGMIAYGAVMMLRLESYSWAMMGGILMVFPAQFFMGYAAFGWLNKLAIMLTEDGNWYVAGLFTAWSIFVGATCIQTLRKEEIAAGFSEKKPGDV